MQGEEAPREKKVLRCWRQCVTIALRGWSWLSVVQPLHTRRGQLRYAIGGLRA